ncbi:10767_t:CDS:2 [Ambispora leptoticha]|uniref:10767_t:CDS:1 n=1 Tax=Ambispora leptoticha TaxID=144679 RepID=A0A9N9EMJ0_9GLOM|nr:10767_t:CDS:2 [Ambispora leptoticha]
MAFLSYQLETKNIDNTKADFGELSFEDQQKFLISLLDKNLLYIPYCDMEDKSYKISEEDVDKEKFVESNGEKFCLDCNSNNNNRNFLESLNSEKLKEILSKYLKLNDFDRNDKDRLAEHISSMIDDFESLSKNASDKALS